MTKLIPVPKISDLLTIEQMEILAAEITSSLAIHTEVDVVLKFRKSQLRFVETRISSSVPEGMPPFMANRNRYNGNCEES